MLQYDRPTGRYSVRYTLGLNVTHHSSPSPPPGYPTLQAPPRPHPQDPGDVVDAEGSGIWRGGAAAVAASSSDAPRYTAEPSEAAHPEDEAEEVGEEEAEEGGGTGISDDEMRLTGEDLQRMGKRAQGQRFRIGADEDTFDSLKPPGYAGSEEVDPGHWTSESHSG